MEWPWNDVRRAIDDSDRQFGAFLVKLPRAEVERLIYSRQHWSNVMGFFDITSGDAARMIYDEIRERARYARPGFESRAWLIWSRKNLRDHLGRRHIIARLQTVAIGDAMNNARLRPGPDARAAGRTPEWAARHRNQ